MSESVNKRIAKNTFLLYFRLLVVMGISLFTVRVVLKTLGVVDYGIYNVVGRIVLMFNFITTTLSTGTVRFFAYQLGENNKEKLNQLFNLSILFFFLIIVVVILFAETIGIWFLNTKMVIPELRLDAANWVFQFSIISFIIHLLTIPYKSLILAHERMGIYAYISVVEVVLKLLIVYILVIFPLDKLKVYSVLMFCSTFVISFVYFFYCNKKIQGCKLRIFWDVAMFKELFGFCGWNLLGAMSSVLRSQGINILLNIFFNPVVNAARAIAFQINNAVNNFVLNFYSAFRPQITKQYASKDYDSMMKLVFVSSRISYYLIFVLALPILLETTFILEWWLNSVPEYTIIFTRLVIINAIIEALSYQLSAAVLATGKNKWYQIITGGILLLNLPISYVFLKLGFPPQITMIVSIVLTTFSIGTRVYFVKKLLSISIKNYLRSVFYSVFVVTMFSLLMPLFIYNVMNDGLLRFIIVGIISVLSCLSFIYFVGITKNERKIVNSYLKGRITHIYKIMKS